MSAPRVPLPTVAVFLAALVGVVWAFVVVASVLADKPVEVWVHMIFGSVVVGVVGGPSIFGRDNRE